ncbi:DUF6665 family protein [Hoeflea prorocentri]|uniref:Uncharacterized protein n=1 Tax=Hoeflea prorocentri TaxID=1922333 RepID=A0A9X3UK96_9HYPH|nr:DUF6665 family protein [Hoeflea prorocentri]MCY6382877.1 hypothetical protein [Hoeflea prorocentri]MDA5400677.1 hypothetical protein [Hoeflea prorocentri]
MSLKVPVFYGRRRGPQTGAGILDYEIMAEMASSIGRAGKALEKALDALRAHDEVHDDVDSDNPDKRRALVQTAADRAWALFIQYDMAGLSSQSQLIKRYAIPGEVLVRVGIRQK